MLGYSEGNFDAYVDAMIIQLMRCLIRALHKIFFQFGQLSMCKSVSTLLTKKRAVVSRSPSKRHSTSTVEPFTFRFVGLSLSEEKEPFQKFSVAQRAKEGVWK
jgi:hypothetical protein